MSIGTFSGIKLADIIQRETLIYLLDRLLHILRFLLYLSLYSPSLDVNISLADNKRNLKYFTYTSKLLN